jgi:hypothetical protein
LDFSHLLSRKEFLAELSRLFPSGRGPVTAGDVRFQVLKAHRQRCTFDVAVEVEGERRHVIAKAFDVDRSHVFEAARTVARSGFGSDAEFAVPRPVAYLRSLNVLLEEKVYGTPAKDVFLQRDAAPHLIAAERSAAWLARFHAADFHLGNTTTPSDLLPQISYWSGRLKGAGEPFASKCESLVRKLETSMPRPDAIAPRPGHGSYIPEHVLLTGSRVITIDLDEHDMADPGRDLAWFVVSLQRLGLGAEGSIRARDAAVKTFLDAYAATRGRDALKHLAFFKAAECLHRAHRDLYKRETPIPGWAETMLDEGLRAL